MKNTFVSKFKVLHHPTYLLCALLIGLIAGSLLGQIVLPAVVALSLSGIYMISGKNRWFVSIVFLSLGLLLGVYYHFTINQPALSGCFNTTVSSSAKKFKIQNVYKVRSNPDFLISTPEDLTVLDQISFCQGQKLSLNTSDERYLLSQLGSKNVFEVKDLKLTRSGHGIRRSLSLFSAQIREVSSKMFSSDQGVLAYGLIFGSSGDFSQQFKASLKASGTTHIVAVSGYNVSIITNWLFDSLRAVSKNFAGVFSVVCLIAFFLMTGGSASVLRASIMGVIILLSKFIGRKVSALHLLILAATLILVFNPYAIFDWGFQLSFMATAGLFFLSPLIEPRLSLIKIHPSLIKVFCETLSAQIFVLPILITSFGSFSLIAPLTNLLILPLVPLAMAVVFLSLVLYVLSPTLGIFFSGITKILLTYIMSVITISSKVPYASINLKVPASVGMIIGYLIVFSLVFFLRRQNQPK